MMVTGSFALSIWIGRNEENKLCWPCEGRMIDVKFSDEPSIACIARSFFAQRYPLGCSMRLRTQHSWNLVCIGSHSNLFLQDFGNHSAGGCVRTVLQSPPRTNKLAQNMSRDEKLVGGIVKMDISKEKYLGSKWYTSKKNASLMAKLS